MSQITKKRLFELPGIIELAELRNKFIHDHWNFDKEKFAKGKLEAVRFGFKTDGNIDLDSKKYTIKEVEGVRDKIGVAQNLIGELNGQLQQ